MQEFLIGYQKDNQSAWMIRFQNEVATHPKSENYEFKHLRYSTEFVKFKFFGLYTTQSRKEIKNKLHAVSLFA